MSNTGAGDVNMPCPACGGRGKSVKAITIESLVPADVRAGLLMTDGFRFCPGTGCDVVYFNTTTGARINRAQITVRVGQKETMAPRPVCYCFDHTVEEIEADVAKTGTSIIPDAITRKCRQGLDRCEETNPQGSCCLGNVRRALREAQTRGNPNATLASADRRDSDEGEHDCCAVNMPRPSSSAPHLGAGRIAQFGALAAAMAASACCWLPLLLIAVGVSGVPLASAFEAWRPVLLSVTFALLGMAFYFTYRNPKASGAGAGGGCCAVPSGDAKGITRAKRNKALLWVVTAFVLAFALFPNYVGRLLGGGDTRAARSGLDKVLVSIEGMSCEACAGNIESVLARVPGVEAVEVSYERGEAVIAIAMDAPWPRETILAAIAGAGDYTGRFPEQVQWTLSIEGMSCEGCAAGLQSNLAGLPGVVDASVRYEEGSAHIVAGASVREESLRNAVAGAGYTVKSLEKR